MSTGTKGNAGGGVNLSEEPQSLLIALGGSGVNAPEGEEEARRQ